MSYADPCNNLIGETVGKDVSKYEGHTSGESFHQNVKHSNRLYDHEHYSSASSGVESDNGLSGDTSDKVFSRLGDPTDTLNSLESSDSRNPSNSYNLQDDMEHRIALEMQRVINMLKLNEKDCSSRHSSGYESCNDNPIKDKPEATSHKTHLTSPGRLYMIDSQLEPFPREKETRIEDLKRLIFLMKWDSNLYTDFKVMFQDIWDTDGISIEEGSRLWTSCFDFENILVMDTLLSVNLRPDNYNLTRACMYFGKTSDMVHRICSKICEHITAKYDVIISIWPAYSEDDTDSVIFMAVTKPGFHGRIRQNDYNIEVRGERQNNSENKDVIEKEVDTETRIDTDQMLILRAVINHHSPNLRKQHSNITFISGSPFRSTGFLAKDHKFVKENCVVIFVHVKGLIPIKEKPVPKRLEYEGCYFGVDVREGTFQLYVGGRPKDVHSDLKIGCSIGPMEKKDFGSLGGFVEHSEYGLCAITCAHVLLGPNQLLKDTPNPKIVCVQPDAQEEDESQRCGVLQHHVFRIGSNRLPGIDAALIKVDATREPLNGLFPDADGNDLEKAGFDTTDTIGYSSGAVHEFEDILRHRDRRLIKFGASTRLRRGVFGFAGAEFAYSPLMYFGHANLILNNQIQVYDIKKCGNFAEPGDSGSLVFSVSDDGLTAIGLVLGGGDGFSVITPICDVLQAFGCSAPYLLKRFPENNNCEIDKNDECIKENNEWCRLL